MLFSVSRSARVGRVALFGVGSVATFDPRKLLPWFYLCFGSSTVSSSRSCVRLLIVGGQPEWSLLSVGAARLEQPAGCFGWACLWLGSGPPRLNVFPCSQGRTRGDRLYQGRQDVLSEEMS